MRRFEIVVSVVAAFLLLACGGAGAQGAKATALTIAVEPYEDARVLVATSMPPQFELLMTRQMPTPGWRFVVDGVEVDDDAGRVVARVSEIGPTGNVSQVITPTECRVPLGTLAPGRYVLELWRRKGSSSPHVLAQALVVVAR